MRLGAITSALRERLGAGAGRPSVDPLPRAGSLRDPLQDALRARVDRAGLRPSTVDGDIVFDASPGPVWTVRLARGRVTTLHRGGARRAASTLRANPATMLDILEGRTHGVDAFLAGRLAVRGNLALPLELDDLLPPAFVDERTMRVRRVLAAGIPTFYLEAGPRDATPVVLLHGLGATSASFLPTIADLSVDHRVIAVDLPGFGESGKPLRPLRPAFFARHLRALLDVIGVDRANLVGNSMGGRVALEVALRSPERVDRVVLLCPSMAWRRFQFARGLVKLLRHEMAVLPIPLLHPIVMASLRNMFADPDRVPQAGMVAAADEFIRVFGTARGRVALFSAAREIYLEDAHGDRGFWSRLPSLSRPALFLFGDRDRLVPAAFSRFVREALPQASIEILSDCGHVPQYEHPERTHALVRAFLRGGGAEP